MVGGVPTLAGGGMGSFFGGFWRSPSCSPSAEPCESPEQRSAEHPEHFPQSQPLESSWLSHRALCCILGSLHPCEATGSSKPWLLPWEQMEFPPNSSAFLLLCSSKSIHTEIFGFPPGKLDIFYLLFPFALKNLPGLKVILQI